MIPELNENEVYKQFQIRVKPSFNTTVESLRRRLIPHLWRVGTYATIDDDFILSFRDDMTKWHIAQAVTIVIGYDNYNDIWLIPLGEPIPLD